MTPDTLSLQLLFKVDAALAERVADFPWVADGLFDLESSAIYELRVIADQDHALVNQLASMPFFSTSIEEHDLKALLSLQHLKTNYSQDINLLIEQGWYQDGLSDLEAIFVVVLTRHADLRTLQLFGPNDFQSLATGPYVETVNWQSVNVPLAGDVNLILFNLPKSGSAAPEILSLMMNAIPVLEGFMGAPFPQKDVVVLFKDPDETESQELDILARFVGTHMIVEPYAAIKDLKGIISHELAHYYLSGSSVNQGLPIWYDEGGAGFLASYVLSRLYDEPLEDRVRALGEYTSSYLRLCDSYHGITNIGKLLELIERDGYYRHQEFAYSYCNYVLGEYLFLKLYTTIGHNPFTQVWREIHDMRTKKGRLITEEEIYEAFLAHDLPPKVIPPTKRGSGPCSA